MGAFDYYGSAGSEGLLSLWGNACRYRTRCLLGSCHVFIRLCCGEYGMCNYIIHFSAIGSDIRKSIQYMRKLVCR